MEQARQPTSLHSVSPLWFSVLLSALMLRSAFTVQAVVGISPKVNQRARIGMIIPSVIKMAIKRSKHTRSSAATATGRKNNSVRKKA
eukprot:3620581-Amphidinium_carterae.1